ncbi:asparagine--tRNA ligase [Sarracenia purpurea var. burkii]
MAVDSFPSADKMSTVTLTDAVEESQFSQRVLIRHIIGRPDGRAGLAGQKVRVGGWVKTCREQGKACSRSWSLTTDRVPPTSRSSLTPPCRQLVPTGTCVHVEGELKVPPEGTK